jgi:hypothetical protein
VLAHFAENLFEVGDRDVLALADGSEGYGAKMLAKPHVNHGGHGKTTFGT